MDLPTTKSSWLPRLSVDDCRQLSDTNDVFLFDRTSDDIEQASKPSPGAQSEPSGWNVNTWHINEG